MKNVLFTPDMSFGRRLSLFFFCFFLCLILTAMSTQVVAAFADMKNAATLDVSIIIQDLFTFILPVALSVFFISGKPLQYLNLHSVPSWQAVGFMLCIFIVGAPAFNYLVEWNANISLPESMKPVEDWMRVTENAAQAVTSLILKDTNIIVCILIIGVLTGFSEELFFRGMLQKMLFSRPMNIHIAIWCAAFIFSALHFQFFGFIPRFLLGAFFGYLVYWSGSLWTAVIAHAFNNSTVVVANAIAENGGGALDKIGIPDASSFPWMACGSLLLTIGCFILFKDTVISHGKQYSMPTDNTRQQ